MIQIKEREATVSLPQTSIFNSKFKIGGKNAIQRE